PSSRFSAPSPLLAIHLFFFLTIRPPPPSTLFPYTTLFRSRSLRSTSWRVPSHSTTRTRSTSTTCVSRRMSVSAAHRLTPTFVCRSEEHTSELQSLTNIVCPLLLEKKKKPPSALKRSSLTLT